MRYLYSLVLVILLPYIFLRLWWRSLRVPAYRQRWAERLGIYKNQIQRTGGIWVHAVSVGEVVAALPLINALLQQYSDLQITVTTTTPTGSQRLMQSLGSKVKHLYAPYDFPWATKRFVRMIQPSIAIILETELWPNILHACNSAGVPVVIANGRISAKSLKGYLRIQPIVAKMLQQISYVAAQSQMDGERFLCMGLAANKLQVCGNLKYDVQIPLVQQQSGKQLKTSMPGRLIWVAASTHQGEEEHVLAAFKQVQQKFPTCLLILVPRHPDRFNEVAKILDKQGFAYIRRSSELKCCAETEVLLGDTMGELNTFYAAADIAFVGGSLVALGGHNLLEPAAAGVATISGPDTSNFQEITQKLLQANALSIITDVKELSCKIIEWLGDAQSRMTIGARALAVTNENQGATQKIMQIIDTHLQSLDKVLY